MKFICFGYYEPEKLMAMSEAERNAFYDAAMAYDDRLRANGHYVGGEALEDPEMAKSLRPRDGRVVVTDGPFAETKEVLGGVLILEARDMEQAVELMSNHPTAKWGPWEIRPVGDMSDIVKESEKRRAQQVLTR